MNPIPIPIPIPVDTRIDDHWATGVKQKVKEILGVSAVAVFVGDKVYVKLKKGVSFSPLKFLSKLKARVACPGHFSDIGRKTRDLLYENYSQEHKLKIISKPFRGLNVSSTLTRNHGLLGNFTLQNVQSRGVRICTDLKFSTDANVELEVSATCEPIAPGLKSVCCFNLHDHDPHFNKIQLEYLNNFVGIRTSIGVMGNPSITFAGVIGNRLVAIGTDLAFDTNARNLTRLDIGLSYTNDSSNSSLSMSERGDLLKFAHYHIANFNTVVGR